MGIICAIFGDSGEGKTTSTIINPDGSYEFSKEGYKGMNPRSHYIINLDIGKKLPFPPDLWNEQNKNYIETNDINKIREQLIACSKAPHIKSIAIDTINIYLAIKEYNERRKMSFDNWRDLANDIIELNVLCNTILRSDQIAYIFGHTALQTQPDGTEKKVVSVTGKKLTKVPPEGFYPILLMTRVEWGDEGENKYLFQTKANRSSTKTPLGMFKDFEIPNSLRLVDETIRNFYKI